MSSYATQDVAHLLGLSLDRVRAFVRSGVLSPLKGPRGEYRFSFQDIVLLRTATGLSSTVPPRKVIRALRHLRDQLPADSPLTSVIIRADGDDIVACGGDGVWKPESGQMQFDFQTSAPEHAVGGASPEADVAVLSPDGCVGDESNKASRDERLAGAGADTDGRDIRIWEPVYRSVLARDPTNVEALVNLGLLLHESGRVAEAEEHYRRALASEPDSAIAAFNLGVALEDLGSEQEAVDAYTRALANDPNHADTHYNLSRLYDRADDRAAALQHLIEYRRLLEE